jgi:hypothetical protein
MCILAWHAHFGDWNVCESLAQDQTTSHLESALKGMFYALARFSGGSLQVGKMIFWYSLATLSEGIKFDSRGDNYMSLNSVMTWLMKAFGVATTHLKGCCPGCQHLLDGVSDSRPHVAITGGDHSLNGDVLTSSTLSAVVLRGLVDAAPRCSGCNLYTVTDALVSVELSRHFLVTFMINPDVLEVSNRKLCCPDIDCRLDIPLSNGERCDHYLDRLIFHHNGNHYNAVLWICAAPGVDQGWYFYDGMDNMPVGGSLVLVKNCRFLGETSLGDFKPAIDMLCAATYSYYPVEGARPMLNDAAFVSHRHNQRIDATRKQLGERSERRKCCGRCTCERCVLHAFSFPISVVPVDDD